MILPQGGITRRPGTRFIAPVKNEAATTILVPFRYSTIQAYMLEFGDRYVRFYKDGGRIEVAGLPVEVSSPYAAADLARLKFSQTADVLSIAHPNYAPYELRRFSHTTWVLRPITFDVLPSREYGLRTTTTLTLSAVLGSGVTATAGASTFLASDVGRPIIAGQGQAIITGFTSGTVVTVTVESTFGTTSFGAGAWKLDASPKTGITPSDKSPVGKTITLTLAGNGFRSTDVASFVHLNGGTVELTTFTSALEMDGVIRGELNSTTQAPSGAWTLEEPAWSALNGYPGAIGAFEDRRSWAGSLEQPQTLWESKSGDFKNFSVGPLDDDAVVNTINDAEVNSIAWILATDKLYLGTVSGVFSVTGGGTDNPLTPANVRVRSAIRRSSSATVAPLRVGDGGVILQVSATGKKVWEIVYSFQVDKLVGPDMLKLADHLTARTPITRWAFQDEPDPTIWAVRSDGVMLACAYMREEDIVGWARQTTQGVFESVATLPAGDGTSQVWAIVRRTINGATRRYVELFDTTGLNFSTLFTDATLTYDGPAATIISGLDHLENMTVQIVGDGAVFPDQVVAGGKLTLPQAAAKVEVGLGYTSTLETMRPEVPVGGSSQGLPKHWATVTVRLLETLGLKIDDERIPFRSAATPLNQVVTPFSGDKAVSKSGWSKDGRLRFVQDLPLPCTITMLTGTLDQGV